MLWIFQVHFKYARVFSPILEFSFNHPLETMSLERFAHCSIVKIICLQIGDVFR